MLKLVPYHLLNMDNAAKVVGFIVLLSALGLGLFIVFWTNTSALEFNTEFRTIAGIILGLIALYLGWMMFMGHKHHNSY